VIMIQTINCYSQSMEIDSIKVSKLTTIFFHWYMKNATKKKNGEIYPRFVKSENGMTTLEYRKYFKNLKKYSFSDSLIEQEKLSYKVCIDNLAKVKYSDFLQFDGLADFEERDCDFTNYYRWIGGQEMFEGYTLTRIQFDNNQALVSGFLYDNKYECNDVKGLKKEIVVTLIRQENKWVILKIR